VSETDVSDSGHDGFDPVRGTDPVQLVLGRPAIEETSMSDITTANIEATPENSHFGFALSASPT
jgi:hypothetical protein